MQTLTSQYILAAIWITMPDGFYSNQVTPDAVPHFEPVGGGSHYTIRLDTPDVSIPHLSFTPSSSPIYLLVSMSSPLLAILTPTHSIIVANHPFLPGILLQFAGWLEECKLQAAKSK